MMRKVTKDEPNYRPNQPRRRRYHGNQFSNVPNVEVDEEMSEETSASAKKLKASAEDVIVNPSMCYRIIEFISVFSALADLLVCKVCKQKVKFGQSGERGLGFKISVQCRCGTSLIQSGLFIHNAYEINRRVVFAMRLLGVAREGINIFCGIMDLGSGLSKQTYDHIIKHVHSSVKQIFALSCKNAVEEEKSNNEKKEKPLLNFTVSGDGSWKKRGFSSLYGVTTLIAYYSGKVIDLIVKSSYCQACVYFRNHADNDQSAEHLENCTITHKGSAGKMEVDAVLEMFRRSEEYYGVRYTNYVGDGDAKTFKTILDAKPYEDVEVIKSECVGHVEKRMGSRLRNKKKTAKLGGRGKLTDALIKKLTKYYGLAIRRNAHSKENMKKEIMATYYHLSSTDKQPQHHFCPTGADSWCAYNAAKAKNVAYQHPEPLHKDVQKHILPIYEDLSRDDLLERCVGGFTQNANESFNATVWRLAPKHLNCGSKIIEIAAYLAGGMFNDGYMFVLRVMNDLQLEIGPECNKFADTYDKDRVKRQNRRSQNATKEARTARKEENAAQLDVFLEEEGLLYGPGIAD
ncbi:uncharacterized protein [Temnothorax nylanderi]|uniref:uncharacterized protein n=1 Tax=Temnothorax nylanderi TaxID=102681 RepID=UPI003A8C8268